MNTILIHRLPRQLKKEALRYGALLVLITASIYLVISTVCAADTVVAGIKQNNIDANLEDGQFSAAEPLTDEEFAYLEDQGVTVEEHFSTDAQCEDGSTLRLFANRELIDKVTLDEGTLPKSTTDIVIDKSYAQAHDLTLGEELIVDEITYTVCGIGSAPDYGDTYFSLSDLFADSQEFGIAFLNQDAFEKACSSEFASSPVEYLYAFNLNAEMTQDELIEWLSGLTYNVTTTENKYIRELYQDLIVSAQTLEYAEVAGADTSEYDDFTTDVAKVAQFTSAKDNPRIGNALRDEELFLKIGILLGVLAMVILAYAISMVVSHAIEKELSVIGTLYALGLKQGALIRSYLAIPVIVAFAGSIFGLLLGISDLGVGLQMHVIDNAYTIPLFDVRVTPAVIALGLLLAPIIAAIVNYCVIRGKVALPPLALMSHKPQSAKKYRLNFIKRFSFIRKFQTRQIIREYRSAILIFFGIFLSLSIALVGIDCYVMVKNMVTGAKEDVKVEYQYVLQYPPSSVPEGAEACYAETLEMTLNESTHSISLMGIESDNPYYDVSLDKEGREAAIASGLASKWGLEVGDTFTMKDTFENKTFEFTVASIVDYDVAFFVLVDIDALREFYDRSDGYFNILQSDYALSLDEERIYTTITREDIISGAEDYFSQHIYLISIMLCVPILLFIVLVYLILSVVVDKSATGISLLKVFGFPNKDIRRMYLQGNEILVALFAVLLVPSVKYIVDKLYALMIQDVSKPLSTDLPFWAYFVIIACVIVLDLVTNALLRKRVTRIDCNKIIREQSE